MSVLEIRSGIYRFESERVETTLRRYTAFVRYEAYGLEAVEEVDVDAGSHDEAWRVAGAALVRDYEPGGVIVSVEERFGLYL